MPAHCAGPALDFHWEHYGAIAGDALAAADATAAEGGVVGDAEPAGMPLFAEDPPDQQQQQPVGATDAAAALPPQPTHSGQQAELQLNIHSRPRRQGKGAPRAACLGCAEHMWCRGSSVLWLCLTCVRRSR